VKVSSASQKLENLAKIWEKNKLYLELALSLFFVSKNTIFELAGLLAISEYAWFFRRSLTCNSHFSKILAKNCQKK
jgi:hypothetical protein